MKKTTTTDQRNRAAKLLQHAGFRAQTSGAANHDAICMGYAFAMTRGAGMLITGNNGTGKTMAAKALYATSHPILQERLSKGLHSLQVYFYEMHNTEHLSRLDNWEPTEGRKENVLLDDVGVEELVIEYGQRSDTVATFINRWYSWWKGGKVGQLIITTNLTGRELNDRYGSRVVDRLLEMCVGVALEGGSRRLRQPVCRVDNGMVEVVNPGKKATKGTEQ